VADDFINRGLQSAAWGDDITRGFRELEKQLRANRKRVVTAGMEALRNQIVEELSHPGSGRLRVHRLTKRKGRRLRTAKSIARAGRASAPGEPPAPDTGKLRGSIQTEYDDTLQKGRVGTNDVRAAALNYGTTRAGKNHRTVIKPRPFMEPAMKKAQLAMAAAGIRELQLVLRTRRTG
jgi:phage gpG-like protein